MGKAEGPGKEWHGHVTAVTVAPSFRRLGVAANMMHLLETISDVVHRGYFVDLFVRCSNKIAIGMYKSMGYSVYRRVLKYYSGPHEEDAFDMRKACSRDPQKLTERPYPRDVLPDELEETMSLPAPKGSRSKQ
jgi:N-terminal acetyltransferase B complex catalytic subunit